jgi:16S rRNA (cytosine967-C5)-methyltransferase
MGAIETKPNDARSIAMRLLVRAEEGAYSNLLLKQALPTIPDARDRALTVTLVNGVLKNRGTLDYILKKHTHKPLKYLPSPALAALRLGAFQLLYLDRIPAAAAVNESVRLTKEVSATHATVVNSVLRRVATELWDITWPSESKDLPAYIAVRYSHPVWMVQRWLVRWGKAETISFCAYNNSPAPTWIRANTLRCDRDTLVSRLQDEGVESVQTSLRLPGALRIEGFGALDLLPAFADGWFTVQDQSSQLAALVLAPSPGERVLDLCSAPGGKATHLAELMQDQGSVHALDIHEGKCALISGSAERLGLSSIHVIAGDARSLQVSVPFDKVLVDVPCSGLGVLRRRADLRWQKVESIRETLPRLQAEILQNAAACVKKGGELLYTTCTVEPEENFDIIKAFLKVNSMFAPVDLTPLIPFSPFAGDQRQWEKGMWQILPQKHDMDGFFLCKLRHL